MQKPEQQKQTLILVSFQSLIFTWDQIHFTFFLELVLREEELDCI